MTQNIEHENKGEKIAITFELKMKIQFSKCAIIDPL